MKCFSFKNGDKCGEQPKTTKSRSLRSSSTSLSTDHDARRVGSELNSQNISEVSTESSGTTSFTSFSGRSTNLRAFKLSELKASTRNFNRSVKVGEGGFGGVFRGVMPSAVDPEKKIDIAVKQLSKTGLQGHKEWVTEVNVLGVVEHPNLVKLIGYCAEDDERGIQRLLIYEYMPNKSVHDHLSSRCQTPLSWISRLRIAQDAARGLAYLHEEMDFQIIFRDFKSSNILLDDEWNAKLSDFGLARLGPTDGLSHVSTAAVGTIGYAAPEYVQTGRLTYKSDVWSYGVFLYELITGRCPVNHNRPKNEQKLLDWIKPHLSTDMKKFQMIIDPRLEGKYSLRTVQKLAAIANKCLVRLPKTRPKMSEVLELVSRVVEEEETKTVPVSVSAKSFALNENETSKSESLKGRLVNPIIGENGWLGCPSWRQKLVRAW